MEQILESCKKPSGKTKIVYQVNLNFRIFEPYLFELVDSGLLIEIPGDSINLYKTSPKGLEALGHIKALRDLLQPVSQEP